MSAEPPTYISNKKWSLLKQIYSTPDDIDLYVGGNMHLYINLACLFGCLFVCLYPINVKTAEPIGPKFFVGHLGI